MQPLPFFILLLMCVIVFLQINALRMAINSLLCNGPSSTLHLTPERICQLQDDCRDGLTRSDTRQHRKRWHFNRTGNMGSVCSADCSSGLLREKPSLQQTTRTTESGTRYSTDECRAGTNDYFNYQLIYQFIQTINYSDTL